MLSGTNTPKRQDQQRQWRYWFITVAFHLFVSVVVAILSLVSSIV
jgi:hypothetical protein